MKCNPDDSLQVSVTTNHASSVDILYMAIVNGQRAYNSVSQSRKKTSHYLEYTAPSGKPANNMTHWHYVVAIHNSTQEPTNFSVQIVQKSGGLKKQSDAFNARVKKQLNTLFGKLNSENKLLVARINSNSAEIKNIRAVQERRKENLESQKAELRQLQVAFENEKNPVFKSQIRDKYNSKVRIFKRDADQFNNEIARWKGISNDNKALRARRDEIDAFGKAVNAAAAKNDFDQCVILANNSPIAKRFGWSPINR